MADLGVIAIKKGASRINGNTASLYNYAVLIQRSFSANVIPLDASAYNKVTILSNEVLVGSTATVTKKTIAGVTKRFGITIGNMLVRILDRETGIPYAETRSDAVGYFNITLYSRAGQQFTVIGYDSDGTDNASIVDLIIPIPV
jgi:hypothetical protein